MDRRPGRDDGWCPTIISIPKRDLLKDVLSVFGKIIQDFEGLMLFLTCFRSLQLGVKP